MVVSVELAKQHLRIDECYTDEDSYIELISKAAQKEAENYCELKVEEAFEDSVPEDFVYAILLLIADAYDKRENRVALHQSAARNLLNPYRVWS